MTTRKVFCYITREPLEIQNPPSRPAHRGAAVMPGNHLCRSSSDSSQTSPSMRPCRISNPVASSRSQAAASLNPRPIFPVRGTEARSCGQKCPVMSPGPGRRSEPEDGLIRLPGLAERVTDGPTLTKLTIKTHRPMSDESCGASSSSAPGNADGTEPCARGSAPRGSWVVPSSSGQSLVFIRARLLTPPRPPDALPSSLPFDICLMIRRFPTEQWVRPLRLRDQGEFKVCRAHENASLRFHFCLFDKSSRRG